MKNIFVGNLDFHTNEDELRQLFSRYGQVDKVSIMTDRDSGRSRGFAFVEMPNTEEGERAINELNGTQLGSRAINVNEARPKWSAAAEGEAISRGVGEAGAAGKAPLKPHPVLYSAISEQLRRA